jgi:Phage capsid family
MGRMLVPEDRVRFADAAREAAMSSLVRAAIVVGRGKIRPQSSDEDTSRAVETFVREKGWADDRVAGILTRAASAPATTSQAGWAKELATVSAALLAALAPASAGAALLQRGLQIDFGKAAEILLPTVAPGICTFVGEGQPIPVRQSTTSAPSISPHKMAAIITLTRELMEGSSAEELMRAALVESVGKGLDAILFDDQPGDTVRPPGLRYGVAGLTPAPSGAKDQAMADDVIALGSAIGAVTGGPITFIAAVPQALALELRTHGTFSNAILPSAALPAGMVIAVGDLALAAALGGPPAIDASRHAEIHRETAPAPIASRWGDGDADRDGLSDRQRCPALALAD